MLNRLWISLGFTLIAFGMLAQVKTKAEVIKKTKTCTSNSTEIINSQEAEFVEMFLFSGFEGDFVGTFGTTVHECLHSYDNQLGSDLEWDDNTFPIAYFVDKDIVVRFPGRRLFKTEELHPSFFSKDVKNLFRYGTYVHDKDDPSEATSNQWGIYGLLEEFNAYYHDVRAQIEYFTCNSYDGPGDGTFGNSMHAYFEFNIFMANYIKYAQLNQKDDYDYMMANTELRTAYTLIESNWRNLLTEIMSDKNLASRMPSYNEEFRLFNDELQEILSNFMIGEDKLEEYKIFLDSRPSDMKIIEENMSWAEQLNLSGFGSGMGADDMTEMYEDFEFELEFEEKDPKLFYVVVLTTQSEEELMNVVMQNFSEYKKLGIIMDFTLNFSVYLNKFSSKAKADKMADEVRENFPDVVVL